MCREGLCYAGNKFRKLIRLRGGISFGGGTSFSFLAEGEH